MASATRCWPVAVRVARQWVLTSSSHRTTAALSSSLNVFATQHTPISSTIGCSHSSNHSRHSPHHLAAIQWRSFSDSFTRLIPEPHETTVEQCGRIIGKHGVAALAKEMMAHADNAIVQVAALQALVPHITDDVEVQQQLVEDGVVDALTTIIEKHNFNQDTLTLATHALLNLSVHVRDAVIQSGAARVVVPSLYNHTKHLKLQLMTCRLLCNLAFDRGAVRTLLEADAIPGFVRTMNDNDFDANIQQAASSAMLILAKHSYAVMEVSVGAATADMLEHHVVDCVMRAARGPYNDADGHRRVAMVALVAAIRLVLTADRIMQQFVAFRGAVHLATVLDAFAYDEAIQDRACHLAFAVTASAEGATEVIEAECVPKIINALERFDTVASIQGRGLGALAQMAQFEANLPMLKLQGALGVAERAQDQLARGKYAEHAATIKQMADFVVARLE